MIKRIVISLDISVNFDIDGVYEKLRSCERYI